MIFQYDPLHPVYGLFNQALVTRLLEHALQAPGQIDPVGFIRQMLSRVTASDPDVRLWVNATIAGQITGHALVVANDQGLFLWQLVGDVDDLLEDVKLWAAQKGVTSLHMTAPAKDVKSLGKKYGFTPYQTIVSLDLTPEVEEEAAGD